MIHVKPTRLRSGIHRLGDVIIQDTFDPSGPKHLPANGRRRWKTSRLAEIVAYGPTLRSVVEVLSS